MLDMVRKLKSLDIFSSFSERELKEIAPRFEVIYVKHREALFKERNPIDALYLILYGSFKIHKSVHGSDPVIFNFLGPGEFLGVAIADTPNATYPATAIANEDSAVLRCSREFFYEVLVLAPAVRAIVNKQIRERFLEFQNDRCMENARVPQRLADFLCRLWERQKEKNGLQIMIPITRKDIAQRLGTHTETVIRILSQWSKKGWIKTANRRIVVHDISKLREICDEKPDKNIKGSASIDFEDVGST